MKILKYDPSPHDKITRNYTIAEFRFSDFTVKDQEIIQLEANNLANNTNSKAANSGNNRDKITKQNDAYAGILAEFATMYFLNSLYLNSAFRPPSHSSINQIDIEWHYLEQKLSIEVRSSFVKNGIRFALFSVDKNTNKTYFDVLGPYYHKSYKADYETSKDVYSRVLFSENKYDVFNRFIKNNECFYVIGFMDGPTLISLNYQKQLEANNAFTKHGFLTGNYYVSPMDRITDVRKIIDNCELGHKNPFF